MYVHMITYINYYKWTCEILHNYNIKQLKCILTIVFMSDKYNGLLVA